jgi:hypothetical protein
MPNRSHAASLSSTAGTLLRVVVLAATAASALAAPTSTGRAVASDAAAARLPTPTPTTTTRARPSDAAATTTTTPTPTPEGRWTPFPFPYWGPQGYAIGPPWFGAGFGGGNWRPIPNRSPFDTPPGSFDPADLVRLEDDLAPARALQDPATRATLEIAAAGELVPVPGEFPCLVYTCRLGVVPAAESKLYLYRDDVYARFKCYLLVDVFEDYGCREFDRLELNQRRTDEMHECQLPDGYGSTPVWTNEIEHRRSKLECDSVEPVGALA